jgi:hypothetical protein
MDGREWVEMHTREQITDDKSKGDVDLWSQYFTYILCGAPEKVHMPDWDESLRLLDGSRCRYIYLEGPCLSNL